MVQNLDLLDIPTTQQDHMVMPVVVGVVVLDILVMDLDHKSIWWQIKFKHHNRKVQMEQIMEKDGGNAAGGNYVGGGGGGIGQNGQASATHPAAPGSPAGGGNGLMIPICPPNYGTPGPSPGRWLGGGGGSSTYPSTSYPGGAGGGNDGNIYFSDTSKSLGWDSPSDIPSNFHTGGGGGGGSNYGGRQPIRWKPWNRYYCLSKLMINN